MNRFVKTALVAAMGFGVSAGVFADNVATQSVTYEVSAINELEVSGNPGALTVSTATAGQAPNSVSDASTTYDITTNETGKKITAAVDTAMPAGVTLTVNLGAPTGATSAGAVTLGTVAANAVTGITTLNETDKTITYNLSAAVTAGVVASDSKTVTFTVTDGGA